MRLKEALIAATQRLEKANVTSPRASAEVLLMFALKCDRTYLYAHSDRALTADEGAAFEAAVEERRRGVPTQYITGHQEFWGMDFHVSNAVLIPRPETEHLVETVLDLVRNRTRAESERVRIADVGTGSGIISIALAKELPGAEIHAIDISKDALRVATANAANHGVAERIHFQQADLLSSLRPDSFDFIVSNPPYVGTLERGILAPEVRDFEPRVALFAGEMGMEIMSRLVPEAWKALKPGGFLAMEIGSTLGKDVLGLLREWEDPQLRYDLQSLPRVVFAHKPV